MTNVNQTTEHKYRDRYWESTQETLVGLYGKRDKRTGLPIETIDDIIGRVANAVALAELKYELSPQEIAALTIEQALQHASVKRWSQQFEEHIGKQKFWANTPANINADSEISLKVLQYWAHGQLAGMDEESLWLRSERLQKAYDEGQTAELSEHEKAMAQLSSELRGKGCLAACGVAYVEDSLEGIQQAARMEALAAKAAMGMGLNTSSLRPWSSVI